MIKPPKSSSPSPLRKL
jgi:integrase